MTVAGRATALAKSWQGIAGAALLVIAAAVGISSWPGQGPGVKQAINGAANHGIPGFNSVAALIGARSPGERPEGELASLKQKRFAAAPHERALAKTRSPAAGTLASIVGPPAAPPVVVPPVAAAPLINTVAPPPVLAAATPIAGVPPGGFPGFVPLPGGGGGVILPPVNTPSTPPVTPAPPITPTPAAPVPEPSAWAMMLLGLVIMGRVVRSRGVATNE